jgi:hypothetical protein
MPQAMGARAVWLVDLRGRLYIAVDAPATPFGLAVNFEIGGRVWWPQTRERPRSPEGGPVTG